MSIVTQERLKELLDYDPETGVFTWRLARGSRAAGAVAKCLRPDGYIFIAVDRNRLLAHRLAWFYIHGEWPPAEIDHINGVRNDNRLENLRLATVGQNRRNNPGHKDSISGLKGVGWHGQRKKWYARISVNCSHMSLGLFEIPEAAHAAYCAAAEKLHGEFARTS